MRDKKYTRQNKNKKKTGDFIYPSYIFEFDHKKVLNRLKQ